MRSRALGIVIVVLLGLDILLRLTTSAAVAQSAKPLRKPISLSITQTDGGNYMLCRMWDDGSIDVKLTNPPRDALTFQEGWRVLQDGLD